MARTKKTETSNENQVQNLNEDTKKHNHIVIFTVGNTKFCVYSDDILKITRNLKVFPLPFMNEYINGVTSFGGTNYAVLDLNQLLMKKKCESSQYVILNDKAEICLHVDEANEFIDTYAEIQSDLPNIFFKKELLVNNEQVFMLNLKEIISKVESDLVQKD